MKTLGLSALALAVTLFGATAASADQTAQTAASPASHSEAWNTTKLRTHYVKPRRHYKARKRYDYRARVRAHLRKRYWGSWSRYSDRYVGFGLRGDGFRTSGKYN